MLQPVVEWNGLVDNDWDLVSWNCCPAGALVHADVIDGINPGDEVVGIVSREQEGKDVFMIASGKDGVWSNLTADMTEVAGWEANWAEVKFES